MSLIVVFGAGCAVNKQPISQNQKMPPNLCKAEPVENDIGALVYPIDKKYERMPHLGQVFTALDCKDEERAKEVRGFSDGHYSAGITLSWGEGTLLPSDLKLLLTRMGFMQTKPGTWKTEAALSMEQIKELYVMLADPLIYDRLKYEDCIKCG